MTNAPLDNHKQQAAAQAVQFVQPGMVLGLGTGSTAIHATRAIAALLHQGTLRDIVGFATSRAVWAAEAVRLAIPMLTEDLPRAIDITIDGADEIDPALNLIKGGGGALLREKASHFHKLGASWSRNRRKFFCNKALRRSRGVPRCRQSGPEAV